MTIYEQLKKAAGMADVIEAAECGYVALDKEQFKKLSGAATPETDETH